MSVGGTNWPPEELICSDRKQCSHLRADTHPDNKPMQKLLAGLGFEKRGIIHVIEDDNPRIAYEIK